MHTDNSVFAVLIGAYDPPCDPGFNCNFDDETVGIGIMFWAAIFVLVVLMIIFDLARNSVRKKYWNHKYGSEDGVIHERADLTRRGYVSSRGQPVGVHRLRREVRVSHECPICHKTSYSLPYHETLGCSPEETCKNRAEHPKQISDPTPQTSLS